MKRAAAGSATHAFEQLSEARKQERYVLRLFVTGLTERSTQAITMIREICDEHLNGRYDLEVVDIYQHPELASEEQIVALPTLVKQLPAPLRRLIGNLSDRERVLVGLDIRRESSR